MKKIILGLFLVCAISIGASAQTTKSKTVSKTPATTTQSASKEKTVEKTDAKKQQPASTAQQSSASTKPKHKKHPAHKTKSNTSTK
jgi:hypothetical protein